MKKLIIKGMDKRYFSDKIVEWYQQNKRKLPWRETKDPYKIWLSEVILQQTRVNQGLPYYNRFEEKFPTVSDLAQAPEQQILRLWQGLGYYTRARNLHKCAKTVAEKLSGQFPNNYEALKKLPGIGDYTAAAIASIAYGEPVAVVDGNVFRVLSRLFGIDLPINSPEGKKTFTALANNLIPTDRPDEYNQAVMEFGALYCTPKVPACTECIFRNECIAFKNTLQHLLPVKTKLKASRKRYFFYLVIQKGSSLAMKKRDEKDIWFGLYDFPLIETTRRVSVDNLLTNTLSVKEILKKAEVISISEDYKHILTHQTIFCKFITIKTSKNILLTDKSLKFYSVGKIGNLPKPVLISKFLENHSFHD